MAVEVIAVHSVPPTNTWVAPLRLVPSIVIVSPLLTSEGETVVVTGVADAANVYDTFPSKFAPPEVTCIVTVSSAPSFDGVTHFISLNQKNNIVKTKLKR